jgi:tetratricopeptide (TPR) repeat protein
MLNRRFLPLCLVLVLAACATQKPVPSPAHQHGHVRPGSPAGAASAAPAGASAAVPAASTSQPLYANSPLALPPLPPPPSVAQPMHQLADGSHVPAVQALLATAQNQSVAGDLDGAMGSLERALRVAPQSAVIYQRMADVRLRQQRPAEAEQLLRKALSLAGSTGQQAAVLRSLAVAEQKQGNVAGAQDALARAAALEGGHP